MQLHAAEDLIIGNREKARILLAKARILLAMGITEMRKKLIAKVAIPLWE